MKILALGYIPKWRGGRQISGLATGLFDLHNSVNSCGLDTEVVIAATDIYTEEKQIAETRVIGWSKKLLVKHAFTHFYKLPLFVWTSILLLRYRPASNGFFKEIVKMLFLDYAINKEKPDVVHLHNPKYAYYRKIIKKSTPVVLRIHGLHGFNPTIVGYKKYRKLEKRITGLDFAFVTFLTTSNKEEWIREYGEFRCSMVVVYNGYHSDYFYPSVNNDKKQINYDLVTIAALNENKGQIRVMDALDKLKKIDGRELSYLIIGNPDGNYDEVLKQHSKEVDVPITFIPYASQKELRNYLLQCHYFILPSITEGFGKVLVESIATGIPVIIPNHLPLAQEKTIINNTNSILLDGSDVDSIYNGLRTLPLFTNDPSDISKTVSGISWRNLALKYIDLYHKI